MFKWLSLELKKAFDYIITRKPRYVVYDIISDETSDISEHMRSMLGYLNNLKQLLRSRAAAIQNHLLKTPVYLHTLRVLSYLPLL